MRPSESGIPQEGGSWRRCARISQDVLLPLLVFGIVLVAGFLLHGLYPLRFFPRPGTLSRGIAWLLFITAGVLMVSATRPMLHKKTDPRLDRPTSALVTESLFKYSRSPFTARSSSYSQELPRTRTRCGLVLLDPVFVLALERAVVLREEKVLGDRFEDEYRKYKNSVRRWIQRPESKCLRRAGVLDHRA